MTFLTIKALLLSSRRARVIYLSLGLILLSQAVGPLRIPATIPIHPVSLRTTEQGDSFFFFRRWINRFDLVQYAQLFENGNPLTRVSIPADAGTPLEKGTFFTTRSRLQFSPSAPAHSGESRYQFSFYPVHPVYGGGAAFLLLGIATWMFRTALASIWMTFLKISTLLLSSRRARTISLSLGLVLLSQAVGPLRIPATISIHPASLQTTEQGDSFFLFRRWINSFDLVSHAQFFENGNPLARVSIPADAGTPLEKGTFFTTRSKLQFSPTAPAHSSENRYQFSFYPVHPIYGGSAAFLLLGISAFPLIRRAIPLQHPSKSQIATWAFRVALASIWIAKLHAVSRSEIVALPFDSSVYIWNSIHWPWGDRDLPSHPSGLPILAGLVLRLGIPWRLFIEFALLGSAQYLSLSLGRLAKARWMAIPIFALIVWHPYSVTGLDSFLSEPLMLVLFLGIFGAMLGIVMNPSLAGWIALTCLYIAWNLTRLEEPLLLATHIVFVALLFLFRKRPPQVPSHAGMVAAAILPLLATTAAVSSVKYLNYRTYRVYSHCGINSPGLMRLLSVLYRIDPTEQIRFAPVTRQSLAAACDESPTLNRYRDSLLDPTAETTLHGERATGRKGEFGTWLNWLLPEQIGHRQEHMEDVFFRAADEIELAFAEGRLPQRSAHFPISPDYGLWLPELPNAVLKNVRRFASFSESPPLQGYPLTEDQHESFNLGALRRAALVSEAETYLPAPSPSPFVQKSLLVALCLGIVIFFFRKAKTFPAQDLHIFLATLVLAISGRLLFYAIVEANTAWHGDRYIGWMQPLLIPVGFVSAMALGLLFGRLAMRSELRGRK